MPDHSVPDTKTQPITLLSFPTSPYGVKVACYLAYKQLDYDLVGVSPITFKQVAFTDKRQVPVLKIGDEWKLESLDIGLWLDDTFPDKPLLGTSPEQREEILAIDNWISEQLITTMFRMAVDWPSTTKGIKNGWTLARAVNAASPMPRWVRLLWPVLIRKAKFIVAMVNALDRSEPLPLAQQKVVDQFLTHLGTGPYLGGRDKLSLADLSAYAVIVFNHRLGLQGDAKWTDNPKVVKWYAEVQQHLPANPFLLEDKLLIKDFPG